MKQIFNPPKWLEQWNRALNGETDERFEQVVPKNQQSIYKHAEVIAAALAALYPTSPVAPTLAQMYYHLVREEVISHNVQSQAMLRTIVTTGLHWGLIDWDHISDLNMSVYESQPAAIAGPAVEVWVEKPGFEVALLPICRARGITLRVLRGRPTACDVYRFVSQMSAHEKVHVVYLCDLDPVAEATIAFIEEQLAVFDDERINVHLAAINEQQIKELALPSNPVSVTAHGAQDYLDRYGTSQWELEALSPAELTQIVEQRLSLYV